MGLYKGSRRQAVAQERNTSGLFADKMSVRQVLSMTYTSGKKHKQPNSDLSDYRVKVESIKIYRSSTDLTVEGTMASQLISFLKHIIS